MDLSSLLPPAIAVAAALAAAPARGQPMPTGPSHRGVVTQGAYQVFPENRPGNAVYGDGILLFSQPGLTVLDVMELPAKGRFVYVARDADQKRTLAVRTAGGDPAPRVTEVSKGYYFVVAVLDGVAYKKFYRLTGNQLLDLLPSSKTADGLAVGEPGILFFHISAIERSEGETPKYAIRVHLAAFGEERVRHLTYPLSNAQPSITLKWLDPSRFQYTLADGRSETLSTAQLQ